MCHLLWLRLQIAATKIPKTLYDLIENNYRKFHYTTRTIVKSSFNIVQSVKCNKAVWIA